MIRCGGKGIGGGGNGSLIDGVISHNDYSQQCYRFTSYGSLISIEYPPLRPSQTSTRTLP